jgi:OmpA-OmpF porin, OOP family
MSKARISFAIIGLASAMAFAGPALSQDTGFYAGIHIGQASAKDGCEGADVLGVSCDDEDTAWKILGGYQFNKNFAVEFGYTDLVEVSGGGAVGNFSTEATAFELVAVGMMPLADRFSVWHVPRRCRRIWNRNIRLRIGIEHRSDLRCRSAL